VQWQGGKNLILASLPAGSHPTPLSKTQTKDWFILFPHSFFPEKDNYHFENLLEYKQGDNLNLYY
jgi:hypothetical protein